MENENKKRIRISVRNLVEFILRSGDIDNRVAGNDKEAMQAGSRLHRKIQARMGSEYTPEVPLKIELEYDLFSISVEGRADGIIVREDGVTIDEIKGVYADISSISEPIFVHKAQAMCYAYIYARDKQLEQIQVQMTYCNLDTENMIQFTDIFLFRDIEEWFQNLIDEYYKWAEFSHFAKAEREQSVKNLEFPFQYREGQKELAVSVYRSIQRQKMLFIQAPTGVGKTMSTIFPAVKSMGEGLGDKLFYLTAKTITRTVAEEAFRVLRNQDLKFRTVTITAKEKLCCMEEMDCNPVHCPYAMGHFDRVNDAVYELVTHEFDITRDIIKSYAEKYNVCPFELSLDVSNWVDGIICDYNYVFDPNVQLKRYFSDGIQGDYIFLVDEAHNLVDRAREMYSADLYKESFLSGKKIVTSKSPKLAKLLDGCNKDFLEFKRECDTYLIVPNVGTLVIKLMRILAELESFLEEFRDFEQRDELLELYFEIRNFLNIHERLDDNYRIYAELVEDGRFRIRLYCVNPSGNLQECLKKGNSTIFFSATLLPVQYYKELLSGNLEDYAFYVKSPFSQQKRLLISAADVSSRYTRRNRTEYVKYCNYIRTIIETKPGNYMVFFPSYQMMQNVYDIACEEGIDDLAEIRLQSSNMDEAGREEFLQFFETTGGKSFLGLCVLGGIFSEGIDLKNDRLIGSIIIGTGLPQICTERQILKEYFESHGKNGFDYAYRYPGINKVLQAAGRVIRTHEDTGVIALLDDRFLERQNQALFPREWDDCLNVNRMNVETVLKEFWISQNPELNIEIDNQ